MSTGDVGAVTDVCELCGAWYHAPAGLPPHKESCPLYSPYDRDPTWAELRERAAYRREKAAHASSADVVVWLRKHAAGMTSDSVSRLYIERAIALLVMV